MNKNTFNNVLKEKNWETKLNKLMDLEFITFDKNKVQKRFEKINKTRKKGYALLVEADVETNSLLNELSGYETTND